MDRKDALALLTVARLDLEPPPPIEPKRMARLFAELESRREARQRLRLS